MANEAKDSTVEATTSSFSERYLTVFKILFLTSAGKHSSYPTSKNMLFVADREYNEIYTWSKCREKRTVGLSTLFDKITIQSTTKAQRTTCKR